MKIIVSNGSYKFHLAALAAELEKRGNLERFLTAGYPNWLFRGLAKLLPMNASLARLIYREENIPAEKVKAYNLVEILIKGGDVLFRRSRYWRGLMYVLGYKFYARRASSTIKRCVADVYHYRDCYGRGSVLAARRKGMVTVCDHSIAHPAAIDWMVNKKGEMPPKETHAALIASLPPHERSMFDDLCNDDYIVANSQFVKQTLVHFGIDESRIGVVYLGVDDQFFDYLTVNKLRVPKAPSKLLFAGGWQHRKGIVDLVQSLQEADFEWELDIAGGFEHGIDKLPQVQRFLSQPNVHVKGSLPRIQLAELMSSHRIFVFPSYCEGSARVVFEAMAAGLYIITTRNAGSIVEDEVHGALVPPGDPNALGTAIQRAIDHPELVDRIGNQNRDLISNFYRQIHYGNNMLAFYSAILPA